MEELSTETLIQIAYALGVGTLIGLERSMDSDHNPSAELGPDSPEQDEDLEPAEPKPPGEKKEYLGVRTLAALSLSGYVAALAGEHFAFIPPVMLLAVGMIVVAMYFRVTEQGTGITTEVAAVATCGLGMLCRFHPEIAAVLAVILTVLLASKRFTHSTVRRMRRIELIDTLKFLVIILIVLPLLPNAPIDPYEALNPYKVGLLVVLVSGIGYVGYFLIRILGAQRGLALTGIIGGLTSSTAVTAAMAEQAKERPEWRLICVAATLAANATMFVRVLVVVAVLDFELTIRLVWSVGGMAVTATLCTVALWIKATRDGSKGATDSKVELKNPFSLGPAVKFAAFFVFILFALKLAQTYLGEQGLYLAAALSGLADVDAITLSLTEQTAAEEVSRRVAGIAITIAVVTNSVTKTGISIFSGGWRFGRVVGACLGLSTVVGLAAALLV